MSEPSSRRFGPYEITSPLGAGGMGEVFRARDTRLGRYIAIKVLPAAFSSDPDRLRRFEQEARAAAALNHPAILAIYDIGTTDDGCPYIVSELLEGHTLGHFCRTTRMPLRTVIDYALQIARGLGAAHQKGIVHRDLKPENIFVTRDGRVKILDFGLAKLLEPAGGNPDEKTKTIHEGDTFPGVVMGTIGYMSPEQVRGLPTDHRTDIFTFGAILYEMLAGKPAFRAITDADTQAAILREDPPHLIATNTSIPPGLEQIVWHCLEKEPQQRFQSASDIAFNLQAMSSTGTTSGITAGLPVPGQSRRLPRKALGALGIAGALALGFGAYWIGRRWAQGSLPQYHQLTYQQGMVESAKFSPDGHTVYCAAWLGKDYEIYSVRLDSPGLRSLDTRADQMLSASSKGELAILQSSRVLEGSTMVGSLARLPLGGGAPKKILNDVQFADWSQDGSDLAIAHFIQEKHAYRLEYPIGKVLFETTGWIGQLRLSSDGRTIAFIDHPVFGDDEGYVAVIPASGGTVRRLSRLWGDMRGLAWHPGGEVWFTATDVGFNYSLYAVTPTGKARQVLSTPGGMLLDDIASDGKVLATHASERVNLIVSTRDHPDDQDLAWLDNTEFFRFSSDGKQIVIGDESEASGDRHASFLRNLDGSSAVRVGDGDGIALSPDGEWVLSRVPPDQLVLLPTGAGEIRRLTLADSSNANGTSHPSKPTIRADLPADWFPDSKRIAFIGDDHRTHLLDLDGNDIALTPPGTNGYLVTADGQSVLVQTSNGAYELFPVARGDPKPLEFLHNNDSPIRFSTDGKDVYVRTIESGIPGLSLYRVNLLTGQRTLLRRLQIPATSVTSKISTVDITPDGSGCAYAYRQKSTALYVVDGLK